MAAKQAGALGRANRLRNGIILLLKRTWPGEFADAERRAGHRLSDLDDELVLAYADSFLSLAQRRPALDGAGVAELRLALTRRGLAIPDSEDLVQWAAAIARQPEDPPTAAAARGGSAPSLRAEKADSFDEAYDFSGARAASAEAGGRRRLSDLTDQAAPAAGGRSAVAARPHIVPLAPMVPPLDSEGWLGDPFGTGEPEVAPLPPTGEPDTRRSDPKSPAGLPVDDAPTVAYAPDDVDDLAALFAEESEAPPGGATLDDLAALFDDEQAAAPRLPGAPEADLRMPGSRRRRPLPSGDTQIEPNEASQNDRRTPQQGPAPDDASPEPAEETEPEVRAAAPGAPLRPSLFPAPTRPKRGASRVPRTTAAPPDAFDVPPELSTIGGELTDATRKALLATVAVPRPIFAADLESVAGSLDLVQTWIDECHSGGDSEIRVVSAKPRHRLRGALVLPAGLLRNGAKKSLWLNCIERYRASAKLYEIGVLLHRVSEEVIAHRLGEHTILLRLSQPRGLVGVVVSLDQRPSADDASGAAVIADLEEVLSERLSLAAVLSIYADGTERLASLISAEAQVRRWAPTFPVVVGRSWEYADDGGSSADLVLGG